MNPTVAHLTARSLLGRRRALLLILLPVILLLLCVAVRSLGGTDPTTGVGVLSGFALGTLVPLIGVIAGTGAIASEIDDGSIMYLLSKPLSRWTIVFTKFAVALAVATVVAAVPTLVAGFVLTGTSDGVAVGYAVGALVAGIGYCALFLLLGVITRNAVLFGLLYALIWESLVGNFVPGAQVLSIQQWALAITESIVGPGAEALGATSSVGLGAAVPLLVIVVIGSLWYAGSRLRTLRLTGDE